MTLFLYCLMPSCIVNSLVSHQSKLTTSPTTFYNCTTLPLHSQSLFSSVSKISTNVPTIEDNFSPVYFEYARGERCCKWWRISINMQTMCRLFTCWKQQQQQHVQQQTVRQTDEELDRQTTREIHS